ncbi:MAG: nucleoside phosphorylase, partial [Chloroflexi bacterium]|nr:nucleoside phosphorylase [Chloroflexota bacterium]
MLETPILDHPTKEISAFLPENLLTRAAVMLGKQWGPIPRCCVLDFDAELAPVAIGRFGATVHDRWPCFHTTLLRIQVDGFEMGLIAGTVGAPFAVLIAEQLIASGCRHVVGYSSAGAVSDRLRLPCLVVPDTALRDEGTSYHYLAQGRYVHARGKLPEILARHARGCELPVHRGLTWTTDAPYRETQSEIDLRRAEGVLSVEMEAAALMALAEARQAEIASLLHITNSFATQENDFEKGEG